MRSKLASLIHCSVLFLSRADVNLCCYRFFWQEHEVQYSQVHEVEAPEIRVGAKDELTVIVESEPLISEDLLPPLIWLLPSTFFRWWYSIRHRTSRFSFISCSSFLSFSLLLSYSLRLLYSLILLYSLLQTLCGCFHELLDVSFQSKCPVTTYLETNIDFRLDPLLRLPLEKKGNVLVLLKNGFYDMWANGDMLTDPRS